MIVSDVMRHLNAQSLNGEAGQNRDIQYGYSGDLLSWVMTHGRAHTAWVTVQVHMNVVAVASSLLEIGCVITAENQQVEQAILDRAAKENIAVFSTALTSYEICEKMAAAGIAPVPKEK